MTAAVIDRPQTDMRERLMAGRELAQRHLRDYIQQAWHVVEPSTPYQDNWHLAAIAEHLEAVTRGEIKDLIINIPPRFAKSLLASVMWPTWEWGPAGKPQTRWLCNSYAQSLSLRDTLRARRVITSAWYQLRWGHVFQLAGDQNLKGRYDNDHTGYRIALSVGGANTGEGGDRLLVDDPHNVLEGESELAREAALTWWTEVMPSRRNDMKTSARVVIMQRVHEADLVGETLQGGGFHLLRLPMEYDPKISVDFGSARTINVATQELVDDSAGCDLPTTDPRTVDGEQLFPERFDAAAIADLRKMGSYAYSAQYQQNPVPRAGAVLDPELFRPLPAHYSRKGKVRIQFWDTAFSERMTADHTVGLTLDVQPVSEQMYIVNLLRDRFADVALEDGVKKYPLASAIADHIVATRPELVGIEEAAFQQAAIQDLVRQVQKLLKGRYVVEVLSIPVDKDKVSRARIVEGRSKAGDIYADRGAHWWTGYAAELAAFPKRKEDDQVDATSGAVTMALEHAHLLLENREIAQMMKDGLPMSVVTSGTPKPSADSELAKWMRGESK